MRGGQEPEPRVPWGNEPGPVLLHCSRWILDPHKVMVLANSERSGDEAASVGLRKHIQALAALERILETLYQIFILFCS